MDQNEAFVPLRLVTSLFVGLLVFVPMLLEARLAASNERLQRARGGVEPAGDVYRLMQVAYPAVFAAMLIEGALGPAFSPALFSLGLVCFIVGKALKYWAIATLGPFWTFRVIVVPGSTSVRAGPYRLVAHPNYLGVIGELLGVALMSGARLAGPIGAAFFIALILRRVAVENRTRAHVLQSSRDRDGSP